MATINPHTTRATGTVLTAAIYNADHQNHITNATAVNTQLVNFLATGPATIAGAENLLNKTVTNGIVVTPTLTLKQSAAPAPTAEGDLQWDTDDNHFAVGNSSSTLKPGKPSTVQEFTANGTWTKPAGCRRIVVEGVGGGGGGGGVNSNGAGTVGGAGGGSSGAFGKTEPINVEAIVNGAVTIGAAGVGGAGATASNGTAGGTTSIVIGATTYAWSGGNGGFGVNAAASSFLIALGVGVTAGSSNVDVNSNQGDDGFAGNGSMNATGGQGGSSPYTQGGARTYAITNAVDQGNAPGGPGGGGGGAASANAVTEGNGGNAGAGFLRVWEFY